MLVGEGIPQIPTHRQQNHFPWILTTFERIPGGDRHALRYQIRSRRKFATKPGSPLPPPDQSGYRNDPIRKVVLERLNSIPAYRQLFGDAFPEVSAGAPIDFSMFGRAIAEFEFTLTFADAPIDEFAQGNRSAMSDSEKRGALLFFGAANCVSCHAVSGQSNEMFSDFHEHNIAVPQIAPVYGVGKGNVIECTRPN